jgi:hypothetical protein
MSLRYLLPLVLLARLGGCEAPAPPPAAHEAPAKPAAAAAEPAAPSKKSAPTPSVTPVDPPTRFDAAPRIVAIGDVHGDLDATRAALRLAGAIDEQDRWIGKDLVLVQTGDQLDRGDDERAILDLLDDLAAQAAKAGGAVHVLNGNHELMNAQGDLRYVTAGGFTDFAGAEGLDLSASGLAQVPEQMRPRVAAFVPGGPYARRLGNRNVVVVVGDTVFAHGGVLPEHVDAGLDALNQQTRAWLRGERDHPPEGVVGERGVVWVRDFSADPVSEQSCETLARMLGKVGAKRLVVGHTVQPAGPTPACDGKVWRIDVGMAEHYGGRPAVLEIRGDDVRAITSG